MSRYHAEHPYVFSVGGQEFRVDYLPAEFDFGMFRGNSNWRGPIWMPMNALIIRALLHYFAYYGDNFRIECPTGSGNLMNLFEVAREIANRLTRVFLSDGGQRPVFGGSRKFQQDPLFGGTISCSTSISMVITAQGSAPATRQVGPGVVASLIEIFGTLDGPTLLRGGVEAAFRRAHDRP